MTEDGMDKEDLWMEEAYEAVDKFMNQMTRRPESEEVWAAGARWGYVAGIASREQEKNG